MNQSSDTPGLSFSLVLAYCFSLRLHFTSESCLRQINMLAGTVYFIFAVFFLIEGLRVFYTSSGNCVHFTYWCKSFKYMLWLMMLWRYAFHVLFLPALCVVYSLWNKRAGRSLAVIKEQSLLLFDSKLFWKLHRGFSC